MGTTAVSFRCRVLRFLHFHVGLHVSCFRDYSTAPFDAASHRGVSSAEAHQRAGLDHRCGHSPAPVRDLHGLRRRAVPGQGRPNRVSGYVLVCETLDSPGRCDLRCVLRRMCDCCYCSCVRLGITSCLKIVCLLACSLASSYPRLCTCVLVCVCCGCASLNVQARQRERCRTSRTSASTVLHSSTRQVPSLSAYSVAGACCPELAVAGSGSEVTLLLS